MKRKQVKRGNLVVSTKFAKIPNEVLEKLCAFEQGSSALRVLIFIIRKTYGYSKTTDCLSLKQIEEATKLSNRTVCRAMRLLKEEGYIHSSKDKDFRKHIPNQVTIVLGTGGVAMENHKLNEQIREKDELWKELDDLDKDDEEATDMDDSRTTDTDDSSYEPQTTDNPDSTTTVVDGIHKRHSKDIEEEKTQRTYSPVGSRPSDSPDEDISFCKGDYKRLEDFYGKERVKGWSLQQRRKAMKGLYNLMKLQQLIKGANGVEGGEDPHTEIDLDDDPEIDEELARLAEAV